jgi:hypothetical protein
MNEPTRLDGGDHRLHGSHHRADAWFLSASALDAADWAQRGITHHCGVGGDRAWMSDDPSQLISTWQDAGLPCWPAPGFTGVAVCWAPSSWAWPPMPLHVGLG